MPGLPSSSPAGAALPDPASRARLLLPSRPMPDAPDPKALTGSAALAVALSPLSPPESGVPTARRRLEFSARGERLEARLHLPPGPGAARPLAIFIHDEVEDREDRELHRCLEAGTGVLELNWPLTGARRSPKMSARLLTAVAEGHDDPAHSILVGQFRRQALEEFDCLLAAAEYVPELDARRIHILDLTFTTSRRLAADEDQESFASMGRPLSRRYEESEGGFDPTQANEAVADFLAALSS